MELPLAVRRRSGSFGTGFKVGFPWGEVWLRILMEEWLVSLLYVWEVV